MTDSKNGKAGDSNGIRPEDIKTCDEEAKEMGDADLQRSAKTKRMYTRVMATNKIESDTQKG